MVIDVKNLTKFYGSFKALDNVSIQVKKGELFGLLGPNGSGKSTIIKILTGQLSPSKGQLTVLGKDPIKEPIEVRKICGIIPEQETPPSFLTAKEYLEFVCDLRGISRKNIEKWFDYLEFSDEKNKLCKDLSRGTRQKIMFAQAFLHEPELAFIDEPLINLDPIIQSKIKDFLRKQTKKGTTIFLSTHVLEIAEEICSSVGIIRKGKIMYQGKTHKNLEKFFLKKVS